VDGEVVGTLEGPGRRRVVGFELDAGEHTVDVRSGNCSSRPDTVTLGPSRIAVLVLDFEERYSGCYVYFH